MGLYRGQLGAARQILTDMEEATTTGPSGSFLFAVAPQLIARIALHQARAALIGEDFKAAVAAAHRALALLDDRKGPRDFWPSHCWELAACRRVQALGLAGSRRHHEAVTALVALEPLLAPRAMLVADAELVTSLREDVRVLKLECEVACRVDDLPDDPNTPAAVQELLSTAEDLLTEFKRPAAKVRMLAIAAKLALLQELPWFITGAARDDALKSASERALKARQGLGEKVAAQKIAPVEIVCSAMRGDAPAAQATAEKWWKHCMTSFGDEDSCTRCARQLEGELRLGPQASAGNVCSGGHARPRQAYQRALREALRQTGVGLRGHPGLQL